MAHAKDKHYWRQLRSVLTAGLWDAPTPAKTPNTHPISWSELLRKFRKHDPGHSDIAELASQTQALSLLLGANSSDRSLDGNDVNEIGSLILGEECLLSEERIEEATAGYDALKTLAESNVDVSTSLNNIHQTFIHMNYTSIAIVNPDGSCILRVRFETSCRMSRHPFIRQSAKFTR